MAEDKKKKTEDEYDIFIANSVYPDAESIFTAKLQSIEQMKGTCLVVLDTNALLVPYNVGKDSLDRVRQTYKILTTASRLIVPGQVAREFATKRADKLKDLFQNLNSQSSKASDLVTGNYPLLESLTEYQAAISLESEINKLLRKYRKVLGDVRDRISSWSWNDPVNELYAEMFTGQVVFDPQIDKEKIETDLRRRQLHKIPPGYKDSAKDDAGIGDLLIWNTILELGQRRKNDLLFVSGDQKTDWWYESAGGPLYPRYELVDEYWRCSEGKSFHIISFSRFLDLFGADEEVVQEVKQEEKRLTTQSDLIVDFLMLWGMLEVKLRDMLAQVSPSMLSRQPLSTRQVATTLYEAGILSAVLYGNINRMITVGDRILNQADPGDNDVIQPIRSLERILTALIDLSNPESS